MTETELHAFFPQFEEELIREMATTCSSREFADGSILMKTGQNIRSTMIVLRGLIKVYREDDEGDEYFMYYIEPGQACAISLICSSKQGISELAAKAIGEVEVISIPLENMDRWMMKYKSWYHFVLGTYRMRFEELLTTIDQVAFRNMDERLVSYLKKNQRSLKSTFIPFTHAEIAQELNSSREVISRLMKKLADRGMIKIHRHNVEIVNLDL